MPARLALNTLITQLYDKPSPAAIEQFYAQFLSCELWIPLLSAEVDHQRLEQGDLTTVQPWYLAHDDKIFVLAFAEQLSLQQWAAADKLTLPMMMLPASLLIAHLSPTSYLSLNPGLSCYKEFAPDELGYLQKAVDRADQLAKRWQRSTKVNYALVLNRPE